MKIVSSVVLLLSVACGAPASVDVVDVRTAQPIVYGDPVGAMDDAATPAHHKATVALHRLARRGSVVYVSPFCSGTLIDDTVVLTAGHCLDKGGGPSFDPRSPNEVAVYVGNDPTAAIDGTYDVVNHLYSVTEVVGHPDFNGYSLIGDLALLRLASAPSEATPAPILRSSNALTEADIGRALDFVGFGEDESGAFGRKLHGEGALGGFGCSVDGCTFAADAQTQISYEQGHAASDDGGPGPCFGDSGGPAFIERNGAFYVGGVTSYGDGECEVYGVSTRTDAYATWIDAFVGGDGESCGNGVCDDGESCDGRRGTLSCADCDGIVKGRPSSRYCFVGSVCEGAGCP